MDKITAGDRFWALFEESIIIQSTVTLLVTATWCVLVLSPVFFPTMAGEDAIAPSKEVWAIIGLLYGYWFGTKKDLAHRKELEQQQQIVEKLIAMTADIIVKGTKTN